MMMTSLIFAFYSKDSLVDKGLIFFLNRISRFYKIVFVYNGDVKNLSMLNENIISLKFGDEGYDLNCYLKGMEYLFLNNESVGNCIFMNNSIIITDYSKFQNTLFNLETLLNNYDFVGVTKNIEIRPHYQTFLFAVALSRFKNNLLGEIFEVIRSNELMSRIDVIEKFELRTIDLLEERNLFHTHLFRPNVKALVSGFILYLLSLGFIDNARPLYHVNAKGLNPSTFMKYSISKRYGFRKIKSSTFLNKFIIK